MKKKFLISIAIVTILLLPVAEGFSQDTSKLPAGKQLKNGSDTVNSIVNPNTGILNPSQAPGASHTVVNPNTGTVVPATTSGTLNSSVNPNTQLVIPIHKNKRKSNSNITPDSGRIAPK